MNRPIKFRAWNKKRKRMYEVLHLHIETLGNGGLWATVKGRDVIEDKDIHIQIQQKDVVIMQYTGLQDKNGTPIYEGDILEISDRYSPQKVYFDSEGFYCTEEFALFELNRDKGRTFEVIGNIWEHPNLLDKAI